MGGAWWLWLGFEEGGVGVGMMEETVMTRGVVCITLHSGRSCPILPGPTGGFGLGLGKYGISVPTRASVSGGHGIQGQFSLSTDRASLPRQPIFAR